MTSNRKKIFSHQVFLKKIYIYNFLTTNLRFESFLNDIVNTKPKYADYLSIY